MHGEGSVVMFLSLKVYILLKLSLQGLVHAIVEQASGQKDIRLAQVLDDVAINEIEEHRPIQALATLVLEVDAKDPALPRVIV